MKMSDERKEYLKEYRREKLKRVPLDVTIEMYDKIKMRANEVNMPVNGFIKWLIQQYLDHEDKKEARNMNNGGE